MGANYNNNEKYLYLLEVCSVAGQRDYSPPKELGSTGTLRRK
jgi:hypothetical protein